MCQKFGVDLIWRSEEGPHGEVRTVLGKMQVLRSTDEGWNYLKSRRSKLFDSFFLSCCLEFFLLVILVQILIQIYS